MGRNGTLSTSQLSLPKERTLFPNTKYKKNTKKKQKRKTLFKDGGFYKQGIQGKTQAEFSTTDLQKTYK